MRWAISKFSSSPHIFDMTQHHFWFSRSLLFMCIMEFCHSNETCEMSAAGLCYLSCYWRKSSVFQFVVSMYHFTNSSLIYEPWVTDRLSSKRKAKKLYGHFAMLRILNWSSYAEHLVKSNFHPSVLVFPPNSFHMYMTGVSGLPEPRHKSQLCFDIREVICDSSLRSCWFCGINAECSI